MDLWTQISATGIFVGLLLYLQGVLGSKPHAQDPTKTPFADGINALVCPDAFGVMTCNPG